MKFSVTVHKFLMFSSSTASGESRLGNTYKTLVVYQQLIYALQKNGPGRTIWRSPLSMVVYLVRIIALSYKPYVGDTFCKVTLFRYQVKIIPHRLCCHTIYSEQRCWITCNTTCWIVGDSLKYLFLGSLTASKCAIIA